MLNSLYNRLKRKKYIKLVKESPAFYTMYDGAYSYVNSNPFLILGRSLRNGSYKRYKIRETYVLEGKRHVTVHAMRLSFKDIFLLFRK